MTTVLLLMDEGMEREIQEMAAARSRSFDEEIQALICDGIDVVARSPARVAKGPDEPDVSFREAVLVLVRLGLEWRKRRV